MFKSHKRWKLMMLCFYVIIFSLSGYATADPLHDCAKEGDIEKVNLLIAEGANINSIDENGLTPLHCAADQGHKGGRGTTYFKGGQCKCCQQVWFNASGFSL